MSDDLLEERAREELNGFLQGGFSPTYAQAIAAMLTFSKDEITRLRSLVGGEGEHFRAALEKIAAFGDPYEIAENPEDFGGTDDGLETVCMAYENMQSIATGALRRSDNGE